MGPTSLYVRGVDGYNITDEIHYMQLCVCVTTKVVKQWSIILDLN